MAKITRSEVMESSAFKMLNSMIDDAVGEMIECMNSVKYRYEQACKPSYHERNYKTNEMVEVFYKPKFDVRTNFEMPKPENGKYYEEGEQEKFREVELPLDIRTLQSISSTIDEITKLREKIEDLQREKLYLAQADCDWQDNGRRSKKVFGVKTIHD